MNTASITTAQSISSSIGALELRDAASGIGDSTLEQTALVWASPSAHPPYCDMRTAMITTCGDDVLEQAAVACAVPTVKAPYCGLQTQMTTTCIDDWTV